jgi:flavorubredoxin
MQLIRCTQKLQKEMGLKKCSLEEAEPKSYLLGSWHANLLHIDRKKCVLFTNDKTLFNFIAPDVTRAQIKDLNLLFSGYLSCVLSAEDISNNFKEKIMAEYEDIKYAATSNKSVLGSMNDLAFHYKYLIMSKGGIHCADVPQVIHELNRMPMGAIGYEYAIDALKAIYKNAT